MLSSFTGGAFSRASVMALGIMPYISASIIVQLMGMAIPYLQKLQKDGESGRNTFKPNNEMVNNWGLFSASTHLILPVSQRFFYPISNSVLLILWIQIHLNVLVSISVVILVSWILFLQCGWEKRLRIKVSEMVFLLLIMVGILARSSFMLSFKSLPQELVQVVLVLL
ncbi:hypothetical protein [Halpernia sp. GG3]